MNDYFIRPANGDDIQTIAEIYVRSWKFAYKGIVPQDYLDNLSVKKYLNKFEGGKVPDEFVLEVSGRIIGLAKLIDCRDRCAKGCAEVQTIYLLPEFTGKGYGVKLLIWLMKKAIDRGYKKMIIWVLKDNLYANKAYIKAGFKKDKARLVIIGGKELKESRYIKVL